MRYLHELTTKLADGLARLPEEFRARHVAYLRSAQNSDGGYSGREGGSGLGLTLARTFVQQHQGTVECESEPGKTVFKIVLPLP